jgi:hypothetical protein
MQVTAEATTFMRSIDRPQSTWAGRQIVTRRLGQYQESLLVSTFHIKPNSKREYGAEFIGGRGKPMEYREGTAGV